jgi:hypothetical protein
MHRTEQDVPGMQGSLIERLVTASVFFVAMSLLESAVVVYLRELYYPNGFRFPLVPMNATVVMTEVLREVATMVMLWTVAALLARTALERFAWFCFGFGIWDLGYYAWLKVLLNWPTAISETDLLFMLPLPWVGPVWAPCLISFGLIGFGLVIMAARARDRSWKVGALNWWLLGCSVCAFLISFMIDPFEQGVRMDSFVHRETGTGSSMSSVIDNYMPGPFNWEWFFIGFVAGLAALVRLLRSVGGIPERAAILPD